MIKELPGYISFSIKVKKKDENKWLQEAGGHRWQRIPPTEKRGRTQTSTITVSVVHSEAFQKEIDISPKDIREVFTRGSGAGGQNRNKVHTAVMLTHIPTGIQVRAETERKREQNRKIAMDRLKEILLEKENSKLSNKVSQTKREQVGSGMRGDKIRTIQVKHDRVINHNNGKETTFKAYKQGNIDLLW